MTMTKATSLNGTGERVVLTKIDIVTTLFVFARIVQRETNDEIVSIAGQLSGNNGDQSIYQSKKEGDDDICYVWK